MFIKSILPFPPLLFPLFFSLFISCTAFNNMFFVICCLLIYLFQVCDGVPELALVPPALCLTNMSSVYPYFSIKGESLAQVDGAHVSRSFNLSPARNPFDRPEGGGTAVAAREKCF